MSPAATRRYRVSLTKSEVHETFVLATDRECAITKAQAIYSLNGLAEFTCLGSDLVDWEAEPLDAEELS